jgi:hypothetical protein
VVQCIQTIDAGGEVDSMLLSGKMLLVGLHCSPEEGMVRAWHIEQGTDLVLPGRHRVSISILSQPGQTLCHAALPLLNPVRQLRQSIRQQASRCISVA